MIKETFEDWTKPKLIVDSPQQNVIKRESKVRTSYQETICKSAERARQLSLENKKQLRDMSPEQKHSLERQAQNLKNLESLEMDPNMPKIILQNLAVATKSYNKKKYDINNGPVRPSSQVYTRSKATDVPKQKPHVTGSAFRDNLSYPVNFYADQPALPVAAQPAPQQSLDLALPSYQQYEANREEIETVKRELYKAQELRKTMLLEADRLEQAKTTVQNIKRQREIEQLLREQNLTIIKLKDYIK